MTSIMITVGKLAEGGKPHLERYSEIVVPLLQAKGARIHGRYSAVEALVGKDCPDLVAIMEFRDAAAMREFLDSPEYAVALPHRNKAFHDICTFACEPIG